MFKGFLFKKDLKKEFYCVFCMEKELSYISIFMFNSYVVKKYMNVLKYIVNLLDYFMDFDLFIIFVVLFKVICYV